MDDILSEGCKIEPRRQLNKIAIALIETNTNWIANEINQHKHAGPWTTTDARAGALKKLDIRKKSNIQLDSISNS